MITAKKLSIVLVAALGATALLSGCARQIGSNVYAPGHVGEASRTVKGVIVSMRQVRVESENLEDNGLGMIGGGVAGGLLGSTVGKGSGRGVATGLGAILGAVGGTMLEREMKSQVAMEYVVKLTDGTMTTVVQNPEPPLAVGQSVLVMVSGKGRSRVVADMTIPVSVPVTEKAPQMVKVY